MYCEDAARSQDTPSPITSILEHIFTTVGEGKMRHSEDISIGYCSPRLSFLIDRHALAFRTA
jgi:hypothetical protein